MTAELVNLRMARKSRARAAAQAQAAANRAKFGETKATKTSRDADTARTQRNLDGARRGFD